MKRYEVELSAMATTYLIVEAESESEAHDEALRQAESMTFAIGQDYTYFGYSVDNIAEADE